MNTLELNICFCFIPGHQISKMIWLTQLQQTNAIAQSLNPSNDFKLTLCFVSELLFILIFHNVSSQNHVGWILANVDNGN